MSKCTLQLQDINEEAVEEVELVVGDGDTLIMRFPEDMSSDHAKECFDAVRKALYSDDLEAIGMSHRIVFDIIKKV